MLISKLVKDRGGLVVSVAAIPKLSEKLGLDQTSETYALLVQVSCELVRLQSNAVAGVCLSPDYTYYALPNISPQAHLLLTLAKQELLTDLNDVPHLLEGWSAEHVRQNYAIAVLDVDYHPFEQFAVKKKMFIAEVYEYAKHLGIDVLLNLQIHNLVEEAETSAEIQLQAVQDLNEVADGFVLNYMGDPLMAATITTQIDVPWLVSSSAKTYEEIKVESRAGLEAGAQGVWVDYGFFPTADMLRRSLGQLDQSNGSTPEWFGFLTSVSRDRRIEIQRIIEELRQKY